MLRINRQYNVLVWTLISLSFIVIVLGVNGPLANHSSGCLLPGLQSATPIQTECSDEGG